MKIHTLNVTQDDINKGVREDPCNCPIALAAKREFPGCDVYVGEWVEVTISKDYLDFYDLDENGIEFIDMFDGGKLVHPINVRIATD